MARYAIEGHRVMRTQERPNTTNFEMLFINHRSFGRWCRNEIGIVVSGFASEKTGAM